MSPDFPTGRGLPKAAAAAAAPNALVFLGEDGSDPSSATDGVIEPDACDTDLEGCLKLEALPLADAFWSHSAKVLRKINSRSAPFALSGSGNTSRLALADSGAELGSVEPVICHDDVARLAVVDKESACVRRFSEDFDVMEVELPTVAVLAVAKMPSLSLQSSRCSTLSSSLVPLCGVEDASKHALR